MKGYLLKVWKEEDYMMNLVTSTTSTVATPGLSQGAGVGGVLSCMIRVLQTSSNLRGSF